MTEGIYEFKNTASERVYVGQSINFRKRKSQHLRELRKGVHDNSHLQSAFSKYGEDKFVWEFTECPQDHLTEMEQWFIDWYGAERLYNICIMVCDSTAGVPLSEEHVEFLRQLHTGNTYTLGQKRPNQMGENNVSRRPDVRQKIAEKLRIFSPEQCVEVYNKYINGGTQMGLAAEYNVGRELIRTAIKHTKLYLNKA